MIILEVRSQWGARKPKHLPKRMKPSEQRGLAVHHSGSAADQREDHRECPAVVAAIQRDHQDRRGWSDVGYNWLSCWHGTLYEGRGLGVRPASQGSDHGNDGWHSVCWLGDGDTFVADRHQTAPLLAARLLVLRSSRTAHLVWPHLRFTSTECPGRALRQWCRQFPD